MKSACILLLCVLLSACTAKAPSADQIETELNKIFKKENPNASAKLTDIEMDKNGRFVTVKFSCTECVVVNSVQPKKRIAEGKGEANIGYFDKWKFQTILVRDENGDGYPVDHADITF